MNDDFQEDLNFQAADNAADDGEGLVLDIDGYEGPLHLLLELARKQKVDLARISILELAEQYISFIKTAQDLRIELAADYLVMASWLAYLKSRLILPKDGPEEQLPEADELAAHLAFRLQRLEDDDRGVPTVVHEGLRSRTTPLWGAEIFDILQAYGNSRSRSLIKNHKLPRPLVLSLEGARSRLKRAIMGLSSDSEDWRSLESLLPTQDEFDEDIPVSSIKASSLLASLELSKEGHLELRQTGAFAPIFVRGADRKVDKEVS